jgi:hypothetical protein
VRWLEGSARGNCTATPGTPQLPLCRERRRADLALAPALAQGDYVGVELEINQSIVFAAGRRWMALRSVLIDALRTACAA